MSKSFTLMELMIVVVIGAIVMVFAIPNYLKTVRISLERQAYEDLTVIWAAVKLYVARNGAYPTQTFDGTNQINSAFNVNIIPNGDFNYYRCKVDVGFGPPPPSGNPYGCEIQLNTGCKLHVREGHEDEVVHHNAGPPCPSCDPYCPY